MNLLPCGWSLKNEENCGFCPYPIFWLHSTLLIRPGTTQGWVNGFEGVKRETCVCDVVHGAASKKIKGNRSETTSCTRRSSRVNKKTKETPTNTVATSSSQLDQERRKIFFSLNDCRQEDKFFVPQTHSTRRRSNTLQTFPFVENLNSAETALSTTADSREYSSGFS